MTDPKAFETRFTVYVKSIKGKKVIWRQYGMSTTEWTKAADLIREAVLEAGWDVVKVKATER